MEFRYTVVVLLRRGLVVCDRNLNRYCLFDTNQLVEEIKKRFG